MRKLATEILFFLWLLEDLSELLGQEEGRPLTLSFGYDEFAALRPEYALSSWRVQLNRLVKDRLILKQTRGQRIAFRLTRLGQERVQQLFFHGLFSQTSEIYSVILLKPKTSQKTQYSSAQRILEAEGYLRLFTGVYFRPGTVPYSDFLWRSLSKQGFLPLFTQIRAQDVRPASLGEVLLEEDEKYLLQASWSEFSSGVDELLSKIGVRNILESRDKERIGQVLVSGLSVMSRWNGLLEESVAPRQELLTRLSQIRALLQSSAQKPEPLEELPNIPDSPSSEINQE